MRSSIATSARCSRPSTGRTRCAPRPASSFRCWRCGRSRWPSRGVDSRSQFDFATAAEAHRRDIQNQVSDNLIHFAHDNSYVAGPELWRKIAAFAYRAPGAGFALGHSALPIAALFAWLALALRFRALRGAASAAGMSAPMSSAFLSSAFFAGMRFEARMMRRDGAIWFALLILAGVTLFALAMGASRVAAQQAEIAGARADETQRLSNLQKTLAQLQQGETQGKPAPEPPPYRDPRNAAFMGGGPAAAVAALAPAPLALVATGQSDLLPPAVRVTTGSKDSFLFADEIDNPANLMSGATDLAFVVVFVYPLVILAMAFNLLAGEREQGTLAMTLASARRPGAALAGKLTARVAAPIAATLLAVAAGVWIFAGWERLASPGFAALLIAVSALWPLLGGARRRGRRPRSELRLQRADADRRLGGDHHDPAGGDQQPRRFRPSRAVAHRHGPGGARRLDRRRSRPRRIARALRPGTRRCGKASRRSAGDDAAASGHAGGGLSARRSDRRRT